MGSEYGIRSNHTIITNDDIRFFRCINETVFGHCCLVTNIDPTLITNNYLSPKRGHCPKREMSEVTIKLDTPLSSLASL